MEESIPKLETEQNYRNKLVLQKILLQQTELRACVRLRNASEWNSENLLLFLLHGTEFRVVFSSAEWFRMEFQEFASIFVSQYRILSIFLLCGMVRNRIPRVFCSAEQRSSFGTNQMFRLLRLPRNNFFVGNSQPYREGGGAKHDEGATSAAFVQSSFYGVESEPYALLTVYH
jgi:hypothetical protein